MDTIKARVHRLPTEDRTDVRVSKIINKLCLVGCDDKFKTFYHLYITTDEEIKEGDWCICLDFNRVFHASGEVGREKFLNSRKIIATTDPKLHTNEIVEEDMHMYKKSLPQIPQSFIEEYCKAGGIDEVLVEYELKMEVTSYSKSGCGNFKPLSTGKPKLNPDNTIIIHSVEENSVNAKALEVCRRIISFMDASPELKGTTMIEIYNKANRCLESNPVEKKMYSRDEFETKLKEAFHIGYENCQYNHSLTVTARKVDLDKWIEENL